MRSCSIAILLSLFAVATGKAQFPPARATNLQVLPADITMDSLIGIMGGFTRALGVRCSHCHVQREGQTFEQIDFSLDDNPAKTKARRMLRMVAAINDDYLAGLRDRRQPAIQVACATCHRGIIEPRPLQQVVLNVYWTSNADSAETVYRVLRARYHGSASYDFGEVPLADVGAELLARRMAPDALRFLTLNVEMNPRSTFALRQLANGYLAVNDTTSAVLAYQRALAINANDQQSRRALDALGRRR